jgi:hypothetical protein
MKSDLFNFERDVVQKDLDCCAVKWKGKYFFNRRQEKSDSLIVRRSKSVYGMVIVKR